MAFIMTTRQSGTGEALALHRFLMRLANAALGAFLWVFVFHYFAHTVPLARALVQTLLLYALVQAIALLLLPFAMRRLRAGMRRGLVWGTLLLAAAIVYVGLLLTGTFPQGAAAIGVLLGAYSALYRVPYAVERSAVGRMQQPNLVGELVLACTPLLVGVMLGLAVSPTAVFYIIALVPLAALLPLSQVPNVYENFSWTYHETFARLAAPENKQFLTRAVPRGFASAALFLLWPLALLFITNSAIGIGAAFSATLLLILVLRAPQRRVLVEHYLDGGSYLDEFTALKEMGLAVGRLAFALVCAITVSVFLL